MARVKTEDWRESLQATLRWNNRFRIVKSGEFKLLAMEAGASDRTAKSILAEWIRAKRLTPIQKGVYLNNQARPAPTLMEAATTILRGGVVSLETALNINDGKVHICAPRLDIDTRFRHAPKGMDVVVHLFDSDMLRLDLPDGYLFSSSPYPAASPEKAIVDWLYLNMCTPKGRRAPPVDCAPVGTLRFRVLEEIAEAMGVDERAAVWLHARDQWEEDEAQRKNSRKCISNRGLWASRPHRG